MTFKIIVLDNDLKDKETLKTFVCFLQDVLFDYMKVTKTSPSHPFCLHTQEFWKL